VRHRLATLDATQQRRLSLGHAKGDMPHRRLEPPQDQVARHEQHVVRQEATVRAALEQCSGQRHRAARRQRPPRTDHRLAVDGLDLVHGGQRIAGCAAIDQYGLLQLQDTIGRCVDGKVGLVHGELVD